MYIGSAADEQEVMVTPLGDQYGAQYGVITWAPYSNRAAIEQRQSGDQAVHTLRRPAVPA